MNKFLTFIKLLTVITVILTIGERLVSAEFRKCAPIKLANGRPKFQKGGRLVRFRCLKGYEFVGRRYMNCFEGLWDFQREQSINMPMCVKPGCRASSKVNGHFLETYKGAVVNVVCNVGYNLIGASTVYCNGTDWNNPFPMCKAINLKPPKSCDFESTRCEWLMDPNGDPEWRKAGWNWKEKGRMNDLFNALGPRDSSNPYADGNFGRYMFLGNISSRIVNATEKFFSPVFPKEYSVDSCFTFWYLLHGKTAGFLKVFVKEEGEELYNSIPPFWVNGDQSPNWQFGYFPLYPTENPFQIIFEGMSLPGTESETAFDDVKILSGTDCDTAREFFASQQRSTSISTSWYETDRYSLLDTESTSEITAEPTLTTTTEMAASGNESKLNQTVTGLNTTQLRPNNTINGQTTKTTMQTKVTTTTTTPKTTTTTKATTTTPKTTTTTTKATTTTPKTTTTTKRTESATQTTTVKKYIVIRTKITAFNSNNESSSTSGRNTSQNRTMDSNRGTVSSENRSGVIRLAGINPTQFKSNNGTKTPTTAQKNRNHPDDQSFSVRMNKILQEVKFTNDHIHEAGDNAPQLIKSESDHPTTRSIPFGVIEAVIATVVIFFCAAVVIALIRRRRRQRTKKESMVEDSDVRFLTSDEFLDFTLARPADDDL